MSVVDMLNKKHKVMNCVFEILAKETDTNRIHEILTKEIRQIIEEILESG